MTTERRPARAIQIRQPRLLLVEGEDDEQFFRRLIGRRQIGDIQIVQFSEHAKLSRFLADVIVADPRFSELVKAVAIVRDADQSLESAFQSVRDSLLHAGLPVPNTPVTPAIGTLNGAAFQVSVYIMPDNAVAGDLETLILRAVEGNPASDCVDTYIECLKERGMTVRHERKAKLHAFLASDPGDPTLQPGQAIDAGVIPWNSPAFDGVHRFLDALDDA